MLGNPLHDVRRSKGMNMRQALVAIRRAAPALRVDFNHVYEPCGGEPPAGRSSALAAAPALARRLRSQ